MLTPMPWRMSWRADPAGRALADRHYNRQQPGTRQFVPPGRAFVLMAGNQAVWVTSWPFARYTKHEWAGAWVNSLFRNEGAGLSSDLIVEAVACTRWHWGDPPALGMVTFIDVTEIRHKRDPGRCYRRAGFVPVGHTKGGLLTLQLLPQRMPSARPAVDAQAPMPALPRASDYTDTTITPGTGRARHDRSR